MKSIAVLLLVAIGMNAHAFNEDAGMLPKSCRDVIYSRMNQQGFDPEVWGDFVKVAYMNRELRNPNGSLKTGYSFYKITTTHGESYLVQIDFRQNPSSCILVNWLRRY